MIKVTVDVERGQYIVSENEKVVAMPMSGQYDKAHMKKIRDQLEVARKWIPTDKKKLIDVGIYNAIRKFDAEFETEYAEKYVNTTIKQIPFTSLGEKKSERERRSTEIKAKEFRDAGISVEYNVSLLKGMKNLGFWERIQAIRLAMVQRQNGVKVNFSRNGEKLLEAPVIVVKEKPAEAQKTEQPKEQLEEDKSVVKPPVTQVRKVVIQNVLDEEDEIPPMPDEETLKKMQEEDEKVLLAKQQAEEEKRRLEEAARLQAEAEQAKALEAQRLAEERARQQQQRQQQQQVQKPKRTIKKCKARQMAKQQQRAGSQMKNMHANIAKARQENRARREATAGMEKQKKPQAEPVVTKAPKAKKPANRTVALAKSGSKAQKEGFATRFTRKLKDRADSIRKMIHIPQLSNKQKKIATATTAVALVGVFVLGAYALTSQGNAQANVRPEPSKPTATETVKPQQLGNFEKEGIVLEETAAPTATPVVSETPVVTQTPEEKTPEEQEHDAEQEALAQAQAEQEAKIAYLSSIRVGANLNISSGKYFSSPDGVGNYGHFENFVDGVKEINMIDIIDGNKYITIKDGEMSLYEIKQQYPNAKVSFHMICRNPDGTTTTLGWYTEESMEQNKEQQETEQAQAEQGIQELSVDDEEER